MKEIWKPIPAWETLYEVSNYGNVRSLERRINYTNHLGDPCVRTFKARTLKANPRAKSGRTEVRLYESRDRAVVRERFVLTSRLAWEAFQGPVPDGMDVDHINENPNDNRLQNLQLLSRADNIRKSRLNKSNCGEAHHNAKLTKTIVREVVVPALQANRSVGEIARVLLVGETIIRRIRDGEAWKHLDLPNIR